MSFIACFAGFSDLVHGPDSQWGSLSCGCHPNCGVGTAIMINKETKEWAPVPRFLDAQQLVRDVTAITDAARGKGFSNFMMALALLKNYKAFQAPKGLTLYDLFKKFDKTWALTKDSEKKYGRTSPDRKFDDAMKRRQDPWNFLFIAGMWFQDLFNYDFRRTEMCIIPYATQQGEISFCAYNTGVGWRKIIENMHKNATVAEWYKTHGKHEIYAKGKKVDLNTYEHSLKIDLLALGVDLMLAVRLVPLGDGRVLVHVLDDFAPADTGVVCAEGNFALLRGVRDDAHFRAAEIVVKEILEPHAGDE